MLDSTLINTSEANGTATAMHPVVPHAVVALIEELEAARAITRSLYAGLADDAWQFPFLKIINPPLWELGHIAWFQEYWCLRRSHERPSFFTNADMLFDSRTVPHATRWHLPIPNRKVIDRYLVDTLAASCDHLHTNASDEDVYCAQLALLHEHMHAEALRMTLTTLGHAQLPCWHSDASEPDARVYVPAQGMDLGQSSPLRGIFAFDNELGTRIASTNAFTMKAALVTYREFGAFIDSGGYTDPTHWCPAGWRAHHGDAARIDLLRQRAAYMNNAVLTHVSAFEASAYAHWAGGALPTEVQWRAAMQARPQLRQSAGVAWEWLADDFDGFDGFIPGPYQEYSAPWFGTHRLLKGGSRWTHPSLRNVGYRNFYTPDRRDVAAGIRLVWPHMEHQ
jgi:gamma-glutamyl hercynylcysteine S-oxide synthase